MHSSCSQRPQPHCTHSTPVPWRTSSLYVLEHSQHSASVELLDGSPGETDGSPDETGGSPGETVVEVDVEDVDVDDFDSFTPFGCDVDFLFAGFR